MSIASEIQRLQTAKADLKTAIEAKGVTVPSNATIDTYDSYVAQISGGLSKTTSGTPYCTGHDLYVDVTTDISIDGGTSWVESGVTTILVESDSSQCIRIPTAYTEVEYVENTGNSSVNLGVYLSSSVGNTFEITMTNTMSYTSGWGEYQTILACMSEAGEPYGGFAYRFYNSESSRQCFLNPTTGQTFSSTTVDSKFEVVISCSGILNGYTHDYPLNLFGGLNSSKTPFRFCKGKVYSLQVTFNDVLTRDLVPCQRKSDSVYGLYDVVGGVFYTSITSTPLIGGQPV